ncbi:hypothetical protein RhiirA5_269102 [Rhizophagus irregularis]|uniref:CUE domain-containing protein n=2 Tax=Rhizophagus irregularis TaxID=588596 RepID=A0A2N0Q4T0_9GLOM|nr:hypothetical protein RhiirA5_269102 [Rhizophagus irregularis]
MSLDSFRNQVLSNSDGEERVEVNQRHLIDKILARYSAEFVVYRELMQNSDDAKSSSVQIIFETANPSTDKHLKDKIVRILFKNNGFAFRVEDWNRLKKIAEGNPDEQKIGAFGVGFYSLFSVCENPFVSSGGQGMAFYWRGDQLFAKRGPIDDTDKSLTTFLMDMREPTEFPDIEEFARFLANSLGFTGNLREVSVYFNSTLVIQLSKKMQEPRSMNIASAFDTYSPQKMFHLTSVDVRGVQLDVKRLIDPSNIITKQWRPSPITNFQTEEASIFLRIASGNLDVKVSSAFSLEMERTTKKKPPNKTTIQMIFTGFDERNSSGDNNNKISPIFKDLLPYPEQGRIYIGFPTHQTTGCSSHLAARVIPTVERESIDLVDKTLAKYNSEMLCLAGILCRILYEDEMTQITRLYNEMIVPNAKIDDESTKSVCEWFENRAAHALTHFTFKPSTPNMQVGKITELQFFSCSRQTLSIFSTKGVLPISNVRMPNSEMAGFIKSVPLVPKIILEQCDVFFKKAKDMRLIEDLTLQDVLAELKNRVLSESEMVELLKWWFSYRSKGNNVNQMEISQFMQLAFIGDKSRNLSKFRYFLNPSIVPPDVDIPLEVLPYTISKPLKNQDLEKWFRWSELSLVNWARFIVEKSDLEVSPPFAEKVHNILARSLNNISQNDKEIIRQLFSQKKCVPTKSGMRIPDEAYFQNVNLFPDLPTVQFQKPQSVQNIMQLLGVRKVVELQLIFDRLVSQGNWDHMQLVKYLASISSNLKEIEIKRLIVTPIWPKEDLSQSNKQDETNSKPKILRFVASDLYAPLVLHREFGLPIIDWKGKWARNTQEGKFLIELGLREYPTLKKILELAAPPTDPKIRSKALKYFIENFKEKYSKDYNPSEINIAFLPCSDTTIFAKPSECFINPDCMIMKFNAIHQDLRFQAEQFGVRQHPSRDKLLSRLIEDPPRDENKAKDVFEYLASRQGDFNHFDWNKLASLKFIPIRNKTQPNEIVLTDPRSCFFKGQEESLNDFFSYINFGPRANRFLQSCGVKDEPSPIEFAELLVKSSHKLWNSIGDNVEKYLNVLRRIAVHFNTISRNSSLIADMKRAPILLAVKKRRSNSERDSMIKMDDEAEHYCLASAKDIFINDDTVYQQVFNPLTVPEEDNMEVLYRKLGCKSLRESVKESVTPIGTMRETTSSRNLQAKIVERARLFYYDLDHPKSEIKKDVEWLKRLKVKEIDQIETSYLLLPTNETRKESTTCCILSDRSNSTLYVTPDPDTLDISQQIVKNIYKSHKWKDISHLNMLLTTQLTSLKRKGYPVDRILRQPKQQRVVEKYDQNIIDQENEENLSNDTINNVSSGLSPQIESYVPKLQELFPDCDPNHIRQLLAKQKNDHLANVANILAEGNYPKINPKSQQTQKTQQTNVSTDPVNDGGNKNLGFFDKVRKVKDYIPTLATGSAGTSTSSKPMESSANKEPVHVTPETTRNLRNSLQESIRTCRSNSGSVIDNQASVKVVDESQTSYCDVIPGHSLNCVGSLHDIELYVPKGADRSEILSLPLGPSLIRFIDILKDLVEVFGLAPKAIHIYNDKNSNSIAFNRDKSLFFNLKFYLGLHDEQCKIKTTSDAMTYWYMTFCHELAHNFVHPHNSEHEFYFSSYAENYMTNFLATLKKREII